VPGYLSEGLTLLGGKAKLGKSWLLLNIAIAVASGGVAMNKIDVEQGDVLALFLEDNERRLQKRLSQLLPSGDIPNRLCIEIKSPRLDEDLVERLRAWIISAKSPRLIIIDVLNRVRPKQRSNEQLYDYDVRSLESLQSLAAEYGIAIVVVHHTRKADADDPFDCLSGSTGLTGTADTTLVLARGPQGTTLYGRGRDVEEIESAMQFDKASGHWWLLGPAEEVHRSEARNTIIDALREAGEALGPREIAAAIDATEANVRKALGRMVAKGEIVKEGRGLYRAFGTAPQPPCHNGHNVTNRPRRPDD
jgi:hypothetical protein